MAPLNGNSVMKLSHWGTLCQRRTKTAHSWRLKIAHSAP